MQFWAALFSVSLIFSYDFIVFLFCFKMDGVSPLPDESPSLAPSSSESFHMSMYLAPSHHMSMASESSRQVFQGMIWSDYNFNEETFPKIVVCCPADNCFFFLKKKQLLQQVFCFQKSHTIIWRYELKCHKILFVVHFVSPFFVHHQDGVRGEHV